MAYFKSRGFVSLGRLVFLSVHFLSCLVSIASYTKYIIMIHFRFYHTELGFTTHQGGFWEINFTLLMGYGCATLL